MSAELLTDHHFEFLSLKGGCIGSSESTLVKRPHCSKPYVPAHFTSSFKQIGISNRFLGKKVSMTKKCHKSQV